MNTLPIARFLLVFLSAVNLASAQSEAEFDVVPEKPVANERPINGELQLPTLFTDNMVLQRDVPCHIWGWGSAGEEVTVRIHGQEGKTVVNTKGKWSLNLNPMGVIAVGEDLIVKTARKEIILKNVVVGDVWICGGQSNMGVGIERVKVPSESLWKEVVETTNFPNLRYMNIAQSFSPFAEKEQALVQLPWTTLEKRADLSNLIGCSAVGFFFSRNLHRDLNIPIGFIRSNVGATCIEAWISIDAIQSTATGKRIVESWTEAQHNYTKGKLQKYIEEQTAAAATKGDPKLIERWKNPRAWPKEPIQGISYPSSPFNAMIAPLTPMTIKGIIWDQGEGNVGRAWQYRELLPLLISNWRDYWKKGNGGESSNLPFYIVQIQDWHKEIDRTSTPPSPGNADAEIRDAQRYASTTVKKCEIVVTIDHHEGGDTHPLLKNIPGERLAAVALAKAYGKEVAWRGPTFKGKRVEGDKIRISFDGAEKGLMTGKRERANILATPIDRPLSCFAIAGADHVFHWASAKIEGNEVIVWSDQVKEPVDVRYAWESNPADANLYNNEGWPATPFRTDDLPYMTYGKEEAVKKGSYFVPM